MARLTNRLVVAAELRAQHPDKPYIELARMIGLRSRNGFGWRMSQYRRATGQYEPRQQAFRIRLITPSQLPLFD